jgi:renalase
VVVGAGVAGLLAARRVADAGLRVMVVDEGPVPGGRLATAVVDRARLDHGAQFFTTRSPEFEAQTREWLHAGAAYEWCRGFQQPPDQPDGYPRYAATGGMAALARAMTTGLDVRTGRRVTSVDGSTGQVTVSGDGDQTITADGIVLTPPVPESLALIHAPIDADDREALRAVTYEPTIAVLAVLDRPSAVPPPGAVQLSAGPFTFVADNQAKGISILPAVTLHATGEVSSARWNDPDLLSTLISDGRRWLAADPVRAELRRWRYARPVVLHPERCLVIEGRVPMVLAGDAFGEAKVEGAARSGWAAAAALIERLAGGQ